ncbi:MAG: hypothetical protein AAGF71_14740 [Pseudomonadota bacterium]
MTLIMDRKADSTELFFMVSIPELHAMFGSLPDRIGPVDGALDARTLLTGTYDVGSWMAERLQVTFDGLEVDIDAMSVMVHPDTLPLPFETPLDGYTAISVCTAPVGAEPVPVQDLTLYAGFIVDGVYPEGSFAVGPKDSADQMVSVDFEIYDNWVPRASFTADVSGKNAVVADLPSPAFDGPWLPHALRRITSLFN